MANSNGKSTSYRWELKNFYNQLHNNIGKDIMSDSFNLGPVSFALFYNAGLNRYWSNNSYGIILKNLGDKQSVEVSLKLWFEDEHGQKFYEHSVEKYTFSKDEDRCKFNVQYGGNDWNLFSDAYNNHKTLFICCEFIDLNDQTTVPIIDCTQFHQNMWLAYEQELHDAIIKIGDTKFKILKAFFMVQSEVFKQMFTLNFKEAKTNIVEIKDVSEQTMEQIIKWMYTCQVDDQGSIEDLFEAADKYQIHLLKTQCVGLLIKSFDNSNVFRRLILAVAHSDTQLMDAALDYIDKMSKNEAMVYLTSSAWFELGQKKPIFAKEVNKLICDKLKK